MIERLIMRHNFGFGDDRYVIGHIGKFMKQKIIILFSLSVYQISCLAAKVKIIADW